MAEPVDATDLKSVGSNPVPVRLRLFAPSIKKPLIPSGFLSLFYHLINRYVFYTHKALFFLLQFQKKGV